MSTHPTPLQHELEKAAKQASPSQPATVSGATEHASYRIHIRQVESLGCQVDELEVSAGNPARARDPESIAKETCRRVTYLMEPLELLESDSESEYASVRSVKPTPIEGSQHYFEAEFRSGSARLSRYSAKKGEERESVPFTVTRETLQRLLDDLDSSVIKPVDQRKSKR